MPNLGTRKSHTTRGYEWVLWHAIQVLPNSTIGLPAAARNEYHYHCKCVHRVFQYKDIEQLIDIVNSKIEINGVDKHRIIDSINSGQD